MKTKVTFENSILISENDNDNLDMFYELNQLVQDITQKHGVINTKHFFVYNGGHHIAIHQKGPDGKPMNERILFAEEL